MEVYRGVERGAQRKKSHSSLNVGAVLKRLVEEFLLWCNGNSAISGVLQSSIAATVAWLR